MAAGRKPDGRLGSSCCIVWRGELDNEMDSQCLRAGSFLLAWFHDLLDHLDDFWGSLLNNVNKDAVSVGSTAMIRQFLACLRALCLASFLRAKVIPIWRKTVFSSVCAVASKNFLLPQELFLVQWQRFCFEALCLYSSFPELFHFQVKDCSTFSKNLSFTSFNVEYYSALPILMYLTSPQTTC